MRTPALGVTASGRPHPCGHGRRHPMQAAQQTSSTLLPTPLHPKAARLLLMLTAYASRALWCRMHRRVRLPLQHPSRRCLDLPACDRRRKPNTKTWGFRSPLLERPAHSLRHLDSWALIWFGKHRRMVQHQLAFPMVAFPLRVMMHLAGPLPPRDSGRLLDPRLLHRGVQLSLNHLGKAPVLAVPRRSCCAVTPRAAAGPRRQIPCPLLRRRSKEHPKQQAQRYLQLPTQHLLLHCKLHVQLRRH